jgi:hypothetical protein
MLTKQVVTGLISILEDKRLQVREDTVILEDTVELSRTYTRYVLNPGDDVSTKSENIQKLTAFLWTTEVIEAWKILEVKLRTIPGSGVPPVTPADV